MTDRNHPDWSRQACEVSRRNSAIVGRNRNMLKICEMLGMEFHELALEPMPVANDEQEETAQ